MFGGFGETETATISRLSILANNPSALEAEIIYLCSLPPEFDRTVHRIQEKRGNTHDVLSALCHDSFRTRCSSSAAHVLRMIAMHLGVPIDVSDVSSQITPVEMIDKLEEAIQRKIDSLVPSEERADFALEKV